MAPRKKTDIVQLSKIRMREALRARLARDAERKDITLNAEIVDRLEQSYANEAQALRDKAVVEMTTKRFVDLLPPGLLNGQIYTPSATPPDFKNAIFPPRTDGAPILYGSAPTDSAAVRTTIPAAAVADRAIELAGALRRDLEALEKLEDQREGDSAAGQTIITPAAILAAKVKEIVSALHRDLEALKVSPEQETARVQEKERSE